MVPILRSKREPLSSYERVKVFEAFFEAYHEGTMTKKELNKRLVVELKTRDERTIRRYTGILWLCEDLRLELPIGDETWKKVKNVLPEYVGWSSKVTRASVENLLRSYAPWKQRKIQERAGEPTGPVAFVATPHIEELLRARDRLAEQVLSLRDPEDEVLTLTNPLLRPPPKPHPSPPGCLSKRQLPPGVTRNELAFRWLREHTRDDPHWQDLEPLSGEGESRWWREYDQYRALLDTLWRNLRRSRPQREEHIVGGAMPFFVGQCLRQALRGCAGRPPLDLGEMVIHTSPVGEGWSSFVITRADDMVAIGGGRDRDMVCSISAELLKEMERFEQEILSSPKVEEIVKRWFRLKERANEFASWLGRITPDQLSRGSCSFCEAGGRAAAFPTA